MIFIQGCSHQKENISLPLDTLGTFSYSGSEELPKEWWKAFYQPGLDSLINTAFDKNFDLKTAWYRLKEANSLVGIESAELYPSLDAFAEGEVYRTEENESESLMLGLSASYEVDLWGRIESSIDAAEFLAKAAFTDYQSAAISVSSEISLTWFRLIESMSEHRLIENQILANEKMLKLIKTRFGSGLVRSVDILRQRQLLKATVEQKILLESRIAILEHRLAVLIGKPPQMGIDYGFEKLPEIPPLPNTGIPIELVKRRPDVKSSYLRLYAADRDMASAVSNQYPRLSISSSITTSLNNKEMLFKNWILTIAGNVLAPIFRGGELSAEVDRTEAIKMQRLYEYSQTVITAFEDVENALIREKKEEERIKNIEEQVELTELAYEQLRIEFFNGLSNYLDVLTTQTELQLLRRDLLSSKLRLIEYRIALYRSLAGGIEIEADDINS